MSDNASKWLLISGVSRGLGLALARDLLARGYGVAGCSTTFNDDLQALKDVHGDKFARFIVDMGDTAAIESYVRDAVAAFEGQRL